jgi:hypothetical protein
MLVHENRDPAMEGLRAKGFRANGDGPVPECESRNQRQQAPFGLGYPVEHRQLVRIHSARQLRSRDAIADRHAGRRQKAYHPQASYPAPGIPTQVENQ